MTLLAVDDRPIQDMRTFALLLLCRSEMLLITMRAVAQNLFQDTYTGKWRLAQNMLWALKQKTIQYSWQQYVKCPFSRLSTNVELQLVTPPLCAGTTVRFARRQSNRHLPPWTTNQNRLGELFTIFWWWQTQMFIKLEKTFSHSSICQWY